MEKKTEIPIDVRIIVPFAEWFDKHPVVMNVIIAIEVMMVMVAVLFYDFTTK